jgi:gamma-glutamyl phosphate reductase
LLARDGSRLLQKLSTDQRQAIINKMASNLIEYSKDILEANKNDLEEANKKGLKSSLISRLGLSEKKLQTLSNGLRQIAEQADVLGLFSKTKKNLFHLNHFEFFRTSCSSNTSCRWFNIKTNYNSYWCSSCHIRIPSG